MRYVGGWWFMNEGLCLMVVFFGYKVDEVDEKGWWWWLMTCLQADRSASVQLVHCRTGPYKESQLQCEPLVCIEVLKIDIIFGEYLSIIKLVPPRNFSSSSNKNFCHEKV